MLMSKMQRFEFLITIDNKNNQFRTTDPLSSLFSNNAIELIGIDKFRYNNKEVTIELKSGKIEKSNYIYFNFILNFDSEENPDQLNFFIEHLKSNIIADAYQIHELWNDIRVSYNQQAYQQIFNTENLMRNMITKFMVTKVGVNWENRIPEDLSEAIKSRANDIKNLYNYDFLHLSKFLFSKKTTDSYDKLIKKLLSAKKSSELTLDEIKSLGLLTNWDKYFFNIIDVSSKDLKKKWSDLSILRNKVAHNKFISKDDYNSILVLCNFINAIVNSAIDKVSSIIISDQDREMLVKQDEYYRYWDLSRETDLIRRRVYDGDHERIIKESHQTKQQIISELQQLEEQDDSISKDRKRELIKGLIAIENWMTNKDREHILSVETLNNNIRLLNELQPSMIELQQRMYEIHNKSKNN